MGEIERVVEGCKVSCGEQVAQRGGEFSGKLFSFGLVWISDLFSEFHSHDSFVCGLDDRFFFSYLSKLSETL